MRIALAQINSTLGDFSSNRIKILEFAKRALALNCDLVVFPEHTLFGYLPNDLLERTSIVDEQLRELRLLEKEMPKGIAALIGCVTYAAGGKGKLEDSLANKHLHNSAVLIERSKPSRIFSKERLPTYDVFDEARHLVPGSVAKGRIKLRTKSGTYGLQVTICEDIWGWGDPLNAMKKIARTGTDVVLNLSASPFTKRKRRQRQAVLKKTAEHFRAPVVYVNMVGAQDEIIFDGRSMVVDKKGRTVGELAAFEEEIAVFDVETGKVEHAGAADALFSSAKKTPRDSRSSKPAALSEIEILRRALVCGVRDFAAKTGLKKVHFGLSGGIDSAVVACIAVDALGADAVTAVTLPGPYNESKSRTLAEQLAGNLGIRCLNMDIVAPFEALAKSFEQSVGKLEFSLVHENMQARVRGVLLMALANKEGSLLLSTGNKSEYAVGYSTIYGDQCGGLAVLGDLLKNEVYALARHYNLKAVELIPAEIIDRAPSAELRPNQKDQDSLPPYDELDAAVVHVIEHRKPARTETEKFVLNASLKSEFKRWQAPPILKVSDHAFGRGRRLPIAHRAKS